MKFTALALFAAYASAVHITDAPPAFDDNDFFNAMGSGVCAQNNSNTQQKQECNDIA